MQQSFITRTRTPLVALALAPALVATLLLQTAAAAPRVERVAGSDRFATAAQLSKLAFPDSATTVFVATGTNYPDAVASGPASTSTGGPVLLVTLDTIPEASAEELRRLKPSKITILGGTAAVGANVETQLKSYAATVTRVAGSDRFDTAARLSAITFGAGVQTAYVATGTMFTDALAGASAAAELAAPLLLVAPTSIPAAVASELTRLKPGSIVVLGPTTSVSAQVESDLKGYTTGEVRRDAGPEVHSTGVLATQRVFRNGTKTVFLATSATFPDALAGGAAAGKIDAALLLVRRDCVTVAVNNEIDRLNPDRIVLLGGTAALTEQVEARQECPSTDAVLGKDIKHVAYNGGWDPSRSTSIGGRQFASAATVEACGYTQEQWLEFDLKRAYAAFRATAGHLDDSKNSAATAEFTVVLDGAILFTRQLAFGQAAEVDVNVVGGLRLRFGIRRLDSSTGGNCADFGFGNPRVTDS